MTTKIPQSTIRVDKDLVDRLKSIKGDSEKNLSQVLRRVLDDWKCY